MKLNTSGGHRTGLLAVLCVVVCMALLSVGVWATSTSQKNFQLHELAASSLKKDFQERVQHGIGNEIRFASASSSHEAIEASVDSAANLSFNVPT